MMDSDGTEFAAIAETTSFLHNFNDLPDHLGGIFATLDARAFQVPLPGEDFYGHDYASRMSTYYFFQPHYPRLIRAVGAELGFDARMGTFRDKTSPTIAASESRPCTGFAQRFGDGGRLLYDSVERPECYSACKIDPLSRGIGVQN